MQVRAIPKEEGVKPPTTSKRFQEAGVVQTQQEECPTFEG